MKIIKYLACYRDSLIFAIIGFGIGLLCNNIFLSLVLCVCLSFVPNYYKEIKSFNELKNINSTLHHSMNLITSTYMQTDDIVYAMQDNENRIKEPLKGIVNQFLAETNFVDANIVNCLNRMKSRMDNRFFQDWVDTLIQCQYDRGLKFSLMAHIERMSDIKKVQDELDTKIIEVYREFISVAIITFTSYPVMRILNKEWFIILSSSTIGKFFVAVTYLVFFISIFYAIKINKPITLS